MANAKYLISTAGNVLRYPSIETVIPEHASDANPITLPLSVSRYIYVTVSSSLNAFSDKYLLIDALPHSNLENVSCKDISARSTSNDNLEHTFLSNIILCSPLRSIVNCNRSTVLFLPLQDRIQSLLVIGMRNELL